MRPGAIGTDTNARRSGHSFGEVMIRACTAGALMVVVLAGCGGGGGGGGDSAAQPDGPASPASIDASVVRIAEVSGSCPASTQCVEPRSLFIDADGEFTGFWAERTTAFGQASLRVVNVAHGTGGVLSRGVVDADYNNIGEALHRTGARQYLYLNEASPVAPGSPIPGSPPGGYTTLSRLVTTAPSGAATTSVAVAAPSAISPSTSFVRDRDGRLSAMVDSATAPFAQATLGGGLIVSLASLAQNPFDNVEQQVFVDFDSIAPRALWAVLGKEEPGDLTSIYVTQFSLDDGTVFPLDKASQQEVRTAGPPSRTCPRTPVVRPTAAGQFAVAWLQQSSALDGCELISGSGRLNDAAWDVLRFELTGGRDGTVVAVWEERDQTTFAFRLRWSRRDPVSLQWSAPLAVDAAHDGAFAAFMVASASGPDGSLALVWEPCVGTSAGCSPSRRLVSKYADGAWTTRSMSLSDSISQIAINAAGQGVVLAVSRECGAANDCTRLSAYRF